MPKLVCISGKDLVKFLEANGFVFVRQKGSHLRFEIKEKGVGITVPEHFEIDRGTLRSIIRSLEKVIDKRVLKERFYK